MNAPKIPVSWGELIDKATILEIKSARLTRPEALKNVQAELEALLEVMDPQLQAAPALKGLKGELVKINEQLWEIEDRIRDKEYAKEFDAEFIELARSVYITNDKRAAVKREINMAMASALVEEKSYKPY